MEKKSKKKFLLAVEGSGSDHTLAIAKYVGQVRDFQESEIVLFYVHSRMPDIYWDLKKDPNLASKFKEAEAWQEQQEISAKKYMDKARQVLLNAGFPQEAITVKIHKRETGIARDIIKEAQKGYNAVIVGRKGTSKLSDLVLGSVSTKLLEKLHFVSLCVVGGNPLPGKVLLAFDGSAGAIRAVDYVGATLGCSDFEILLAHVIRGEKKEYLKEAEMKIGNAFDEAKNRLINSGFQSNQINTKIITHAHSRAGAIIKESVDSAYDTIVMGRRGLSEVYEFSMGRVSNKVIQLAKEQAVWIVN